MRNSSSRILVTAIVTLRTLVEWDFFSKTLYSANKTRSAVVELRSSNPAFQRFRKGSLIFGAVQTRKLNLHVKSGIERRRCHLAEVAELNRNAIFSRETPSGRQLSQLRRREPQRLRDIARVRGGADRTGRINLDESRLNHSAFVWMANLLPPVQNNYAFVLLKIFRFV